MSAEVWYYPETDEWKIKNVDKADGSSPTVNHNHVPDTWERIIEDARAYSMNISGNYLWKNKSDELVARCKALAGDEDECYFKWSLAENG